MKATSRGWPRNGLLTPTLKLKRGEIEQRHARDIEAMYAATDACAPGGSDGARTANPGTAPGS